MCVFSSPSSLPHAPSISAMQCIIYIYICICVYVCVYTYIYVCVCVCVCVSLLTFPVVIACVVAPMLCKYAHMYISHSYVHICMRVCMYVCVRTFVCVVDIILGLNDAFKNDADPRKVNLGVGAFRNDRGEPVVLNIVREVCIYICVCVCLLVLICLCVCVCVCVCE